jgi:predicted protein tyrosine phosphatase
MIEIYPNLFVGDDTDAVTAEIEGMVIVHAAKDPWHRAAVGYTTRSAPQGPEYLSAIRGPHLSLNLVDSANPQFISKAAMYDGCNYIENMIRRHKVLVHCNQGQSRGPGLVFLYLWHKGVLSRDFDQAIAAFKKEYPPFAPGSGVLGFLKQECQ